MAPRDMLAAASSQGGDAAGWTWYVALGLTILVTAVVLAGVYFRTTLRRWAPWLFALVPAAVVVAAIAGVDEAGEILRSRAERGPDDFGEFVGMCAVGALIMFIAKAFRGRGGEDGGWEGVSGACDDEGGWWDGEGD